jgi:methanogenic corrinoid protein MtbC1
MALDTHEMNRLLREAVDEMGVVDAWDSMAVPVLSAIGERWRVAGDVVDVEHAFSESLLAVLRGVCAGMPRPRNVRPVLLGCAEGDYHTLPLHALAAALAEERVGTRMLGVGMPSAALVSAVRRSGPAAVFLFARLPAGDPAVLDELPRMRPAPRVLVGGCGWDGVRLPAAVLRADSLTASVDAVLSCLHI